MNTKILTKTDPDALGYLGTQDLGHDEHGTQTILATRPGQRPVPLKLGEVQTRQLTALLDAEFDLLLTLAADEVHESVLILSDPARLEPAQRFAASEAGHRRLEQLTAFSLHHARTLG